MDYEEIAGPPGSPIERIWCARSEGGARETILPDGRFELVFNFGDVVLQDGVPQPRAMLAAEPRRAVTIEPSGRVEFVGVTLRDGRTASILGAPPGAMRDRMLDLRDLGLHSLYERLGNESTFASRASHLVEHLRMMQTDVLAETAARAIRRRAGQLSITRLASALGVTIRTLGRAFERSIGVTPKTLARVVRLHRAGSMLREGTSAIDVAYAAGFSDQSHLVNEFRSLSGVSPSRWIALPGALGDHFFQDAPAPPA
jgi:AraC-like DNA-binding protein